jgi:two-component system cell cycle response regulator DivK
MKSIVLIEDNSDNRLLISAMLSERYQVIEFETGFEALMALKDSVPNLILLDISLPGMDGWEVLSLLRAEAQLKDVPVIALTASATIGDRERYLRAGFNDYVPKPILDEKKLLQAIEQCLSGQTSPQE